MLFKRMDKPRFFLLLRNLIWPKKGWRRAFRYNVHRIKRLNVPPRKIAIGFAWGAAFGFTPLIGLHFILAPFFSWLTGGHVMSSLLGTLVCNPWTAPFIFLLIYNVGIYFLGHENTFTEDITGLEYFTENFMVFFKPMLIGSIPVAILIWITTFFLIKRSISIYHNRKSEPNKNTST